MRIGATLVAAAAIAAHSEAGSCMVQDVNAWLTSAYRCDLPGPEVWTGPRHDGRTWSRFKDWNNNVPFRTLGVPMPGMSGQLHVAHEVTNVSNAVTIEVEEDGRAKVEFVSVRNHWTPAFCTTHYRSVPTGLSAAEREDVGRIVLRETKAILADNTFLAEATLKNASASSLVCRVSVKTCGGLPTAGEPAREWRFATRSMARDIERRTFAACVASFGGAEKTLEVPARGETTFRYALALSPVSAEGAAERARRAIGDGGAFKANAKAFNEWFARNVPTLETGNPDLLRMYLYRWFVVKRGTHDVRRVIAEHEYPRTAVYESPVGGWYNCVIGLPVPLQIQELAWERSPETLRSHILNWCEKVKGYRGYIQFTGEAIARSFENHPSPEFAKKVLPAVAEYARECAGPSPDKLPVQKGSWGTGAEYQPNFYQFTDPPWDFRNDTEFVRGKKDARFHITNLVRLDKASYAIGNLLGAAKIAEAAGDAALAAVLR